MPLAPTVEFKVRDNDNDPASFSLHVEPGFTLAQYGELANDTAALVEALLLGALEPNAQMTVPVDISALTNNTLVDTSDVEQVAAFSFIDANGEPVDFNIPGLNTLDDVLANSDALDQADTDIAAIITMMETGIAVTAGTIQPSSIAESDIVDTLYARRETKASGKRRRR